MVWLDNSSLCKGMGYSQQAKISPSVKDRNEGGYGRIPLSYACYEAFHKGPEGKG